VHNPKIKNKIPLKVLLSGLLKSSVKLYKKVPIPKTDISVK
jgi:hypothetical protein